MKVIGLQDTNLDSCISEARQQRVVITRNGKPVALVVGVEGLDAEQVELGANPTFWELIARRRRQRAITRALLEQRIDRSAKGRSEAAQQRVAPDAGSGAPEPVSSARKRRSRRRR